MKQVILKSLTLCNFKGAQALTTNFNVDVTTISGGNGLGKSRHFDAFIWCLFGKDAQDRKDYEVRTRNADGTLLHEVECSVTAIIEVDGEEITLKRESVEEWVKPRGQVDRVLKGTHNECWWNEAPVKVNEFNNRVASILDQSLFKMITNPMFFVGMDWRLQREQLFQLAGTITDAEIAQKHPDFALLLDKLNGKSLADFKAEISAKKARLKKELDNIQPRIDQTQKLKPESEDFDAIEKEISDVDTEIADIDKILSDNAARIRAEFDAQKEVQRKIAQLEQQRQSLVIEAQGKAKNEAFEANSTRREVNSSIESKKRELSAMERALNVLKTSRERTESEIKTLESDIVKKRDEWHVENQKQYSGDDTCHHCGQPLPESMREANLADFKATQKEKKERITKAGQEMSGRLEALKKDLAESDTEILNQEKEIEKLKNEIKDLEKRLSDMPEVSVAQIVPENVAGYDDLTKKIDKEKEAISTETAAPDDSEYKTKKKELTDRRDALKKRLANRETIAKCDNEMEKLRNDGKDLAQQIADLEKQEFVVQEFTRTKIDECESRINNLFHHITFRLFDKTFEGNIYETCIPLVNGVPFGAANTAGQVNAGLDIINTLCRFHGICAPIFIDNRESVNDLIPTQSQIINLVVNRDKKLTIQ